MRFLFGFARLRRRDDVKAIRKITRLRISENDRPNTKRAIADQSPSADHGRQREVSRGSNTIIGVLCAAE